MGRTSVYDFHLALERHGKGYLTRVLRSLEGRGAAKFVRPSPEALPAGLSLRQQAEARGRALFDALFAGAVREKFRACLKKLEGVRDGRRRTLRVRLAIDPDVPHLAPLFEIDWEQMFDAARDRFLTRSQRTTLVRDLELPTPLLDLPGARPLRLLVVGAQPNGWPSLDFDVEYALIEAAWEGFDVQIKPIPRAQLRDLEARLQSDEPFHILHFIGHGEVDAAEVEGYLILERADGSPHPVSGKQLAERLDGNPHLRLVVLNACESAQGPSGHPSRSVAGSLMKAGVPAVIAMSYEVQDGSAAVFSDGFYRALACGNPVDAAMTAARLAIDDSEEHFEEWAKPVLFMSSDDGLVFQFAGAQEKEAMEPKRLGIRTRKHPFGDLYDECEHVLDLLILFDGRSIRNPGDWKDKVLPFMDHFFRKHVRTRRSLELRFDAHLTVALAAGWLIDTRGVDVTIRQALPVGGFRDWTVNFDRPYEGPLWKELDVDWSGDGNEVAVAVGITNANRAPVQDYVERNLRSRVRRILAVLPDGEPSNTSIRSADHAFALAQDLKRRIDERSQEEQGGPIHLFLATPVTFAFYLGQLLRGQGQIQLYEWEFEKKGSKTYVPSLLLETEDGGRR